MTDTSATAAVDARLDAAVRQNPLLSRAGLLERLFARLFRGLVYAQIWEDPVCDMAALGLGPRDHMVCIASGGCNVMSYLTAGPASITAVDLSPAHVALLRLKLAAAERLTQAQFFDLFGHADRPGNVALYDRLLAPALDAETRAWWEARGLRGRRIAMLARGFYRHGLLGRFLGAGNAIARLLGSDLRGLLDCTTVDAQRAFYAARVAPLFDRPLVRRLGRSRAALFGLGIPPAQHEKLARDGGGDVLAVLEGRLRRLFCGAPVSENYFAWQAVLRRYPEDGRTLPPYLQPCAFAAVAAGAQRVTAVNAALTDQLAMAPAGSKTAYVLLDAQDWMSDAQLGALWAQITRTAAPGARVLFRTGGAADILPGRLSPAILDRWRYDAAASERATADDRSAIYGGVHLYRLKP